MSSFGARRKAKVIVTKDDGAEGGQASGASAATDGAQDSIAASTINKTTKKPFRASGLRKAFNAADNDEGGEDDEDDGPVVVRPGLQKKKKPTKSKLSFGADNQDEGDDDGPVVVKPSKAAPGLSQRVLENTAMKRNIGSRSLPLRSQQEDDDDSRPKYSKEYLNELQSSTPTTPRDVSSVQTDEDAMELDSSELDGALVVDSPDMPSPVPKTQILTDAEIREKKERRARLAKEQDFLSVEDNDDDYDNKKKSDTRLKADDEEVGEGFDDYVEDGGLSLGKRAEKERRKRDRQKMAELITAAEGNDTDSSSDSDDADGRIAYEAAQTRAGMDGLKKPAAQDPDKELLQIPQKITPLPILSDCLGRLQASLQSMQVDLTSKRMAVEQLRKEKEGITTREKEVQALLDETGKKYQEAMGQTSSANAPIAAPLSAQNVTEARGLDSLGTTPNRAPDEEV